MTALIRRIARPIAALLIVSLAQEIVAPLVAHALTSGPAQPEFSSFEPVATTNMVNEFTGQFTYNLPVLSIPGPNGGGYAMSLSYHSGASPEEEASWVGYGWTLNPGSIVRNKRGFPDDYKGASIKYWNKVDRNWTITMGRKANFEVFSKEIQAGVRTSIRYNNYKGFGYSTGLDINVKGVVDLGYSVTDGESRFSFTVNPAKLLYPIVADAIPDDYAAVRSVMKLARPVLSPSIDKYVNSYLHQTFGGVERTTNFPKYIGMEFNFNLGLETDAPLPAGLDVGLFGSFAFQDNVALETIPAFGYMYSAMAGGDDMMDYYDEQESPYDKRDAFLSIPFSNADNFAVSGEGVGGGFRLYNINAGLFSPVRKTSTTGSVELGGDLHVGGTIGVGANMGGIGLHTLHVERWGNPSSYLFASPESCFFRFNNDPGGSVLFDDNDRAVSAATQGSSEPNVGATGLPTTMQGGMNSGRSSYIGYNTNQRMTERPCAGCLGQWQGNNFYRSYTKNSSVRGFVDRNDAGIADGIGEFSILREDGSHYVYGLPVYSRNEKQLQIGLSGLSASDIDYNYIAYKSIDPAHLDDLPVVTGEEDDRPYASTYLLTEITTPDYVDRTNDGPTSDDLGGYTKFNYARTAGADNKSGSSSDDWYRWRIPYTGLLYKRNSLTDPKDDRGAVTCGEKEIYYLQSIETRTHIAVFVTNKMNVTIGGKTFTGSNDERADGYEAHHDESLASGDRVQGKKNSGANRLRKLERIELYAKDENGAPGKLLTTVRFEYAQPEVGHPENGPAWPGAPNVADGQGKLTLKRVWFEHEGAANARISPYIFDYVYPTSTDYDASIRTGVYADIVSRGDQWTIGDQTPSYSPFDIDRWGNYQLDGQARQAIFNPWVNQVPDAGFDPAAWQLKRITLPSGGEIHVQYESHDYCYVQDRAATVMVRLQGGVQGESPTGTYTLDIAHDLQGVNINDLAAYLNRTIVGEYVPFKFLYALTGVSPSLTSCTSEYITGYAKVSSVSVGGGSIVIALGQSGQIETRPISIAQEFYRTSRSGILMDEATCDPASVGVPDRGDDVLALIYRLLPFFGTPFIPPVICQAIDGANSYIRIPLPPTVPKKGGGIRVKRLLMYDPGIESGDAALYGTEYSYVTGQGYSSGVATNEPATGREENALVTYLKKRSDQPGIERALSGRDVQQFEGPIGESILPGPSIGYSRVVSKNIHSGKTNPGFTVSEFYTVRDFPFDKQYATPAIDGKGVDYTSISQDDDLLDIVVPGLASYHKANLYRTQGYRFIISNMHGQPRRISAYGGDFSNPTTWVMASSQEYSYVEPGEPVLMVRGAETASLAFPGKETEVVFESRSVEDITYNGKIEADGGVLLASLIPGFPFASIFPAVEYNEEKMRTHVTNKVVSYPVMQKSVLAYKDGVYHLTENVAFNPDNGRVVRTRTADGYDKLTLQKSTGHDGSYYSQSFPASWFYPAMGQRASGEGTVLGPSSTSNQVIIEKRYYNGKHYLNFVGQSLGAGIGAFAALSPGDLVEVRSADGSGHYGVYQVGTAVGSRVELLPTNNAYADANPLHTDVVVEVIHSARSNQLDASAGSITTYGRPPIFKVH